MCSKEKKQTRVLTSLILEKQGELQGSSLYVAHCIVLHYFHVPYRSKNWEVVAVGEKETKEQRYTRLKLEIEGLIEEMLYFTVS